MTRWGHAAEGEVVWLGGRQGWMEERTEGGKDAGRKRGKEEGRGVIKKIWVCFLCEWY